MRNYVKLEYWKIYWTFQVPPGTTSTNSILAADEDQAQMFTDWLFQQQTARQPSISAIDKQVRFMKLSKPLLCKFFLGLQEFALDDIPAYCAQNNPPFLPIERLFLEKSPRKKGRNK